MGRLAELNPVSFPTGWERRKRQTEQALVDAARALFARQGYEQTTVAEIAEEAGVGLRTFYRYFPAKEWIACHGVYRFVVDGVAAVRERPVDETPLDSLIAVIDELEHGGYDDALSLDALLVETIPSVAGVQHHVVMAAQDELTELFAQRLGTSVTDLAARLPAATATLAYQGATRTWMAAQAAGRPGPGIWALARTILEKMRPALG